MLLSIKTKINLVYITLLMNTFIASSGRSCLWSATTAQYVEPRLGTVFGERAFSFAGSKSRNDLPSLIYPLLLRTPANGSLRAIFLIRSLSLQFNFIFVYYEVTVLLPRCTFYCNLRTTRFDCIVLYCFNRQLKLISNNLFRWWEMCLVTAAQFFPGVKKPNYQYFTIEIKDQ